MAGKFTKNTLITIFTQGLIFAFSLVTSVIVARILGPEKKGIYSLVVLLPIFLVYFTNFGIGQSTVFYLGKRKYPPKEIFGNNIIYTTLLSTFAILIGLVIIFFFSNKLLPSIATKFLFLSLLLIPGKIFFGLILYFLLGFQKIKQYNFILFFRVFLIFLLVGILLWIFHFGITAVIITELLSVIIVCIVLFSMVKKETNGISFKPDRNYFKNSFSYGIKFYLGSIFYFLQSQINILLINFFLNPAMVGFYSLSVGLSSNIWLISDAVGTVLFPKVSSENDKKKMKEFTPLVFRNVLFIIMLIAILLFGLSHWIIALLYSDAYLKSIQPFKILLIGVIASSGWKILENDLNGQGKPMLNTYITGVSLVSNIILSILWIPKFGILGAAWATTISYTVALLMIIIIYAEVSGNKIKDVIFIKKSDLMLYQNLFINFKDKIRTLVR
jgi:O-antigen/teichoic acid export membrane protein